MTCLEKMLSWLEKCPLIGKPLTVDYTEGTPGSCGLYPTGVRELSRKSDVAGNTSVTLQSSFLLRRVVADPKGDPQQAGWLLQLQTWLREQSLSGQAPQFGDQPCRERIICSAGKLDRACKNGTVIYSLQLQVEFIKNTQAKE